jgi:glycosyltransferase involved in cell wall biosynthesis
MTNLVALDGTDAFTEPLRGWGRYVAALVKHLPDHLVHVHRHRGPVPEVLWEQVGLPVRARASGAGVIHAPNCFLPLIRSCPGVVTVHDLAFEEYPEDFSRKTGAKYRFFTPRACRSAERVVCVSRFTAGDVVARYGIDEAKIRVIPNAPSLPVGSLPVPDGAPYLLAVGDLRPKKNLGRLVEAWRRLGSGHRLVLVGHGAMTEELPAGVEVTGYLADAELDALLRGADLLVHPSLYEGFGLVVAEAMVRGTPVACSNTTALPETAGGAAELFDPHDVEDMAAAIDRALARRDELRALGLERARAWSWERTAAQVVDVYRELL